LQIFYQLKDRRSPHVEATAVGLLNIRESALKVNMSIQSRAGARWAIAAFNTPFLVLLCGAICFLFSLLIFRQFKVEGLFETLGMDYRVYHATGVLLREKSDPYDWNAQQTSQLEIASTYAHRQEHLVAGPMFYPPLMAWFFLPLAALSPDLGFFLWTLLTILGSALYLRFFVRALEIAFPWWIFLFSLPFMSTVYYGQISLLLLIASGEWLRNYTLRKEFNSGLSAAAFFIKPQLLALILPFLVCFAAQRNRRGFFAGLAIILVACLMSGLFGQWIAALGRGVTSPDASISAAFMPNLRSAVGILR